MPAPRAELDPDFRRELLSAWHKREAWEARFRGTVLRGLDEGQALSAMARELDIDRRLLWKWVQRWTRET